MPAFRGHVRHTSQWHASKRHAACCSLRCSLHIKQGLEVGGWNLSKLSDVSHRPGSECELPRHVASPPLLNHISATAWNLCSPWLKLCSVRVGYYRSACHRHADARRVGRKLNLFAGPPCEFRTTGVVLIVDSSSRALTIEILPTLRTVGPRIYILWNDSRAGNSLSWFMWSSGHM